MKHNNGRVNLSTGGGLGAIVLWSLTVALVRPLSERLGPLTAGACVYLIGGFFCLVPLVRRRRELRELAGHAPRYVFGCGFLFVLYTAVLFLALGLAADRKQTFEIGMVNYLWPALTVAFSFLLLNQRARLLLLVPGTALALVGEFLVITHDTSVSWGSFSTHLQGNPAPYALAFVGAVAWALYSSLTPRWSRPGAGGAVELFIPVTGLVLLILSLLSAESPTWSVAAAGEAVALAIFTTAGYALWDAAMRKGNRRFVVACSYLTPLLSTVVSCVRWQVRPGWRLWLGCLVLVIGSLLTWLAAPDRESGNGPG